MEKVLLKEKLQVEKAVQAAISVYGSNQSELVELLKSVNDTLGFLPAEAFVEISRQLGLPVGQVYSVASFYTMLLMEPRGRHLVLFCESAPCHVAGARQLGRHVIEALGINPGETSEDGRWTLLNTSCLGQCSRGPVIVVDDDIYGPVTKEMLTEIFEKYD